MPEYRSPYSLEVDNVVRATGLGARSQFSRQVEIDAVVHAVDIGLCKLMPFKDHPATLFDPKGWSKEPTGIELTERGRAHYEGLAHHPIAA